MALGSESAIMEKVGSARLPLHDPTPHKEGNTKIKHFENRAVYKLHYYT